MTKTKRIKSWPGGRYTYCIDEFDHGELHSWDDEPSRVIGDIFKEWHKDGALHRTKGPASINIAGAKQWWVNGKKITRPDILKWLKDQDNPSVPFDEDIETMFKLRYEE